MNRFIQACLFAILGLVTLIGILAIITAVIKLGMIFGPLVAFITLFALFFFISPIWDE